jgi:hypothetical protein
MAPSVAAPLAFRVAFPSIPRDTFVITLTPATRGGHWTLRHIHDVVPVPDGPRHAGEAGFHLRAESRRVKSVFDLAVADIKQFHPEDFSMNERAVRGALEVRHVHPSLPSCPLSDDRPLRPCSISEALRWDR